MSTSSVSTLLHESSTKCVIMFLASLCLVSAWNFFEFMPLSRNQSTILFCFQNISSAVSASNKLFKTVVNSLLDKLSFAYMHLTFFLNSYTSFYEYISFCCLRWLNALRLLEIWTMIFASAGKSGELYPSNVTCLISSLSNHLLSHLIFYWP